MKFDDTIWLSLKTCFLSNWHTPAALNNLIVKCIDNGSIFFPSNHMLNCHMYSTYRDITIISGLLMISHRILFITSTKHLFVIYEQSTLCQPVNKCIKL